MVNSALLSTCHELSKLAAFREFPITYEAKVRSSLIADCQIRLCVVQENSQLKSELIQLNSNQLNLKENKCRHQQFCIYSLFCCLCL